MSRNNDSWGIEVGSNALKAMRLVRRDQEVEVAEYEVIQFKRILTTPDLDVDQAIQVNLDQFMSKHNLKRSRVVVSVPGNMAFAKFAKLPPVDPKKINDIVNFEAVQQIPFPIEQVEWDYQVFSQPESPDVEVGIFAITKDRVMRMLSNYQAVGISIDGLTLSALAVFNGMAYDMQLDDDSPGVMMMDIGTSNTDVIIFEGGSLWLRTLPIGGNTFTEALVRAFKLSYPKAEKLKREAGTSKYARQIFQAMRPVFAELVQEMQRTLGYYQSLNREAKMTKMIGLGSTFKLPGLQKFLKQQLQMDVVRPDRFQRIGIEGKREADFSEHALNLATAYGLALQGLGLDQVNANILPSHMVKQRLWSAKQPWIAAAAVVMLVASVVAWSRLIFDSQTFNGALENSQPKISKVLDLARDYKQKWSTVETKSDPRPKIENLRRVLDYRDVWPKLMHDLTLAARALEPQEALLQTDHAQIAAIPVGERRRVYIDSISAEYQFKLKGGSGARAGREGHLVDDIWGPADADGEKSGAGGSEGQVEATAPSFIVTLRGVTPHRDGGRLLSDRFIWWLRQNAQREDRPYRILDTNNSLVNIGKIVDEKAGSDAAGARPAARVPRNARAGRRVRGIAGRRDGSSGVVTDSRDGQVAGASTHVELDKLLPKRPKQADGMAHGQQFEIQFTIELVRPEQARLAQKESET